jgi:hypothetical protein
MKMPCAHYEKHVNYTQPEAPSPPFVAWFSNWLRIFFACKIIIQSLPRPNRSPPLSLACQTLFKSSKHYEAKKKIITPKQEEILETNHIYIF